MFALAKAAAALVVLAAAWFLLAPAQLGGKSTYLVTYGTSMQPVYHAGDLAVIRPASSYHVGEIVGYRNMQLGGHLVLHRIIGIDNGVYTFKGDNNHFIDSFHPNRSELVGRLWFHVPGAGKYLLLFHGPRLFLLAGLVALLLVGGAAFARTGRVRGRRADQPQPAVSHAAPVPLASLLALAALLACGALAAASYTRPLTKIGIDQGIYTQTGRFSYSAQSDAPSPIYGGGRISTGQPLFLSLVQEAAVRFAYRFESKTPNHLSGRVSLSAKLAAPDGWQHTLPLAAPQPFTGGTASVEGALDLVEAKALVSDVAKLSSASGQTYTLTLTPHVRVAGTVDGRPIQETFAPSLPFLLDSNQLQLQPGTAGGPASATLLTQSTSGSGPVLVPNTITLPKLRLAVARARRLSLYGVAGTLVLLLGSQLVWLCRRARDEAAAIDHRFGELIIDVTDTPQGLELPTVTLGSIDSLAQIAQQAGRMILHLRHEQSDVYFVEDNGFVYTFQTTAPAPVAQPHSDPITAR